MIAMFLRRIAARLDRLADAIDAVHDDVFTCRYCRGRVDFLKPYHSDERGLWHWECGQ